MIDSISIQQHKKRQEKKKAPKTLSGLRLLETLTSWSCRSDIEWLRNYLIWHHVSYLFIGTGFHFTSHSIAWTWAFKILIGLLREIRKYISELIWRTLTGSIIGLCDVQCSWNALIDDYHSSWCIWQLDWCTEIPQSDSERHCLTKTSNWVNRTLT